ncbi:MAG: HPF/RaiA family ribosome-associated protein [Arenicellales bacterium]
MAMPVEISFHKMEATDALHGGISRHAEKLGQFEGDIISTPTAWWTPGSKRSPSVKKCDPWRFPVTRTHGRARCTC